MNPNDLIIYILFGDFGLLTMTPTYLLCILSPLITLFYFTQSFLEDSGLLARLALRCDKPFSRIGLSGKALIPMLLGFGCTTAALAAVATLENKRERLIASIILSVIVPCSAQTAIILALSFLMEFKYTAIYIIFIMSIFLILGYFLNLFLPGIAGNCAADRCPALRFPDVKSILYRSIKYCFTFLRETAPPFVIGSLIVSLLTYLGTFSFLCSWFAPFTSGFLHLPQEASSLFILSMIKRDLGAAGLLSIVQSGSFTQAEITVSLIILTLFVPCFASVVVLFKQQKPRTAIFIWLGSFLISLCAGKLASLLIL